MAEGMFKSLGKQWPSRDRPCGHRGGEDKTCPASRIDELTDRYKDIVIRVVVPTIPLARQWQKALLHHMPSEEMRPGFFSGERRDDRDADGL